MLNIYEKCTEEKEEIDTYVNMLKQIKELPDEHKLRGITKHILFFKTLVQYEDEKYYKNFMIYDMLMLMHSLTQNSKRNFYNTYRSLIENFLRYTLDLDDDDSTGVRNLFKLFRERFSSEISDDIINFIEGEYSNCSDFVHSNKRANISVKQYYDEILKLDDMNENELKKMISKLVTFFKKIVIFMIYTSSEIIDGAFFRKKQKLKFLIGDSNYTLFEENIN